MTADRCTPRSLGPLFANIFLAGVASTLILIAINVARHPLSVRGAGSGQAGMVVAILLLYGGVGVWARYQQSEIGITSALWGGAKFGLLFGALLICNHVRELFLPVAGPVAQFIFGAGPVLLMLALFGAAGSAGWECTRSVGMAVVSGLSCSLVGVVMLLAAAFALYLVFERNAELQLQSPFVASGMKDPGAFLVRNSLEAAWEGLVRMPIFALLESVLGALGHQWIVGRSRGTKFALAWLVAGSLLVGVSALWYAAPLPRQARPPFIVTGVLMTGFALGGVHPIWFALRRNSSG